MHSYSFLTSVEFYVILTAVAAAVVAFAARPESAKPVEEHLLAGWLEGGRDCDPSLRLECLSNGKVRLDRYGVEGICDTGAVSLAIAVKGTDIDIKERITPGSGLLMSAVTAMFTLDFLPPGRYHIKYTSDSTGLFAAFSFTVKPGIVSTIPLSQ